MVKVKGQLVKIGTAAELLGVSVQTLRNWDDAGELSPAHRSAGGTRWYAVSDLTALAGGTRCPRCGAALAAGEQAGNKEAQSL